MCTGMKEWLADVRAEGKIEGKNEGKMEGKNEGLDLSCKIISDIIAGKDVAAIASKYDVDDNHVLMIIHAMKK